MKDAVIGRRLNEYDSSERTKLERFWCLSETNNCFPRVSCAAWNALSRPRSVIIWSPMMCGSLVIKLLSYPFTAIQFLGLLAPFKPEVA
jgi:hypothetical protein